MKSNVLNNSTKLPLTLLHKSNAQNVATKNSHFKTKCLPFLKDLGVDMAAGSATAAMKASLLSPFSLFGLGAVPAALMYPAYRGYEGVQHGKKRAGVLGAIAFGTLGVGVGSIEGIIKSTVAVASVSGLSLLLRSTGFKVPGLLIGAGVGAAMFGATRLFTHLWLGHENAKKHPTSS